MRRLMLAALATLLVACGGDKATAPDVVSGNYTLRTVNGTSLPATFYLDQAERDEFLDGSIALASDHSWSGSLSVRATAIPGGGLLFNGPLPVGGTYSLSGSSITLTDGAHGLSFAGTIASGTLNVAIDLGDVSPTRLVFIK